MSRLGRIGRTILFFALFGLLLSALLFIRSVNKSFSGATTTHVTGTVSAQSVSKQPVLPLTPGTWKGTQSFKSPQGTSSLPTELIITSVQNGMVQGKWGNPSGSHGLASLENVSIVLLHDGYHLRFQTASHVRYDGVLNDGEKEIDGTWYDWSSEQNGSFDVKRV